MRRGVREYYRTHTSPSLGKVWTEEEKKRVSEGVRRALAEGKMRSKPANRGAGNGNSRRVLCVDTGIEYASAVEAAEATGIDKHYIWANARGDRKDAGGMQWQYLEPSKRTGKMPESFRENKRGEKNGRTKALRCIETGVIYKTGRELAKELGINHSSVSAAMGRNGKIKGLHYEFIDKEKSNGTCFSESKENPDEN